MHQTQSGLLFLILVKPMVPQHIGNHGRGEPEHNMTFLRHIFPRPISRQELERAYLNQSVSLYDLECRQRDIDHGKFAGL